ncbi:MAG: hypothetical protein CSA75_04480, partial [Sorangium cellulosum]
MNRIKLLTTLAGVVLLSVSGCDDDPAKGKTKVAASAVQPVNTEPNKGAVKYRFDAKDSKFEFVGAKVTAKHEGSFGAFEGTIDLVGRDPTKSKVVVEIVMDSLKTDSEKLTEHLKDKDFFDVAKHPKSKFTSTGVKKGGSAGASHTVTGNLELHGVTKSMTFPATIRIADGTIKIKAEFAINRKDFGV